MMKNMKLPLIRKRERYTENDALLSEYFIKCLNSKKEFPKIQKASIESGISTSTISRYVRRKGFISYEDMKSQMIRESLDKGVDDYGLVNFLRNAKEHDMNIVIISSAFTKTLAVHLSERLKYLKYRVRIAEENLDNELPKLTSKDCVIATTLTMESARAQKAFDYFMKHKNPIFIITTVDIDICKYSENFMFAALTNYSYANDFRYSGYQAVRQIFNMIDDCLNIVHMELHEK